MCLVPRHLCVFGLQPPLQPLLSVLRRPAALLRREWFVCVSLFSPERLYPCEYHFDRLAQQAGPFQGFALLFTRGHQAGGFQGLCGFGVPVVVGIRRGLSSQVQWPPILESCSRHAIKEGSECLLGIRHSFLNTAGVTPDPRFGNVFLFRIRTSSVGHSRLNTDRTERRGARESASRFPRYIHLRESRP